MAEITHKEDHAGEAVARLMQALKDTVSVPALVRALAGPAQELEDVFQDLTLLRRLDTAQGAQLDVFGRILKYPRNGATDDAYRMRLRARALVLDSGGTLDQLRDIILALVPGAVFLILPFVDPMSGVYESGKFRIEFLSDLPDEDAETIAEFIRESKLAAVGFEMIWSPDVDNAFTFTADDTVTTDTLLGFADADTPTTGGYFVGEEVG